MLSDYSVLIFCVNRVFEGKERASLLSWYSQYARVYIPKLGTKLGPLYSKTSPHGDKRLKPSDINLIRQIQSEVQNLPDLEFPPENAKYYP